MASLDDGRANRDEKSHYRRAALSQPLRRRIARQLALVEVADAAELAAALGVQLSRVAYHLDVLHRLGVLRLSREQRQGPPRYRWRANAKWARDVLSGEEGKET